MSPVTNLNYTKRTLEIHLYYQMENFMKIEQTEAYSGTVQYIDYSSLLCCCLVVNYLAVVGSYLFLTNDQECPLFHQHNSEVGGCLGLFLAMNVPLVLTQFFLPTYW